MTQEKILEGNKLIAEFMGADKPSYSTNSQGEEINCSLIYNNVRTDYINNKAFPDNFKFHSSLEWLMPVVEKIKEIGAIIQIQISLVSGCRIEYTNLLIVEENNDIIKAVFEVVIKFIKWYNENKK